MPGLDFLDLLETGFRFFQFLVSPVSGFEISFRFGPNRFRFQFSVLFLAFLSIGYFKYSLHDGDPIVIFDGKDINPNAPMVTFQGQMTNSYRINL